MLPVWIQYLNGQLQFFPHAEGYVKPNGTNSYLYVYQYKDHLGNVRLSYADCDGDGTINPATEILEENNYYPFGLKHQGYNDIANSCRSEEAEAYKFLNKEYEDSFALNVTETDFRHYDSALGRFSVMDALSELAYDYTPYRYGFNNPVFFSDPSGLFETWGQAISFMLEHGISGNIIRSEYDDTYVIAGSDEFSGRYWENFYETAYHPIVIDGNGNRGGGNGNGGGKREGYRPTFREIHSVIANNSNFPMGVGINLFNLNMSMLTGKDRHLYGPDAIVLTKDVTGGAGVGGTVGLGYILLLRGDYAGAYPLGDYGVGLSTIDISTGFTAQALYYSGSLANMKPNEFEGVRYSASVGFKELAHIGLNASFSPTELKASVYGLGVSLGIGASFSVFNLNANYGNTTIIYNN